MSRSNQRCRLWKGILGLISKTVQASQVVVVGLAKGACQQYGNDLAALPNGGLGVELLQAAKGAMCLAR